MKKKKATSNETSDEEDEEEEDHGATSKSKKSGGKKRKSSSGSATKKSAKKSKKPKKGKKSTREGDAEQGATDGGDAEQGAASAQSGGGGASSSLDEAAEEMRMKEEIYSNLPADVVDRFLEVGFGKWSGRWLPILELGPFDVKGMIRERWMKEYHRYANGSRRDLPRIVYWYGVPKDRSNEAFSFLDGSQIVSYDDGVTAGRAKLPSKIERKINSGKKLAREERDLVLGLEQIKQEVHLQRDDRMEWMKLETDAKNQKTSAKTQPQEPQKPESPPPPEPHPPPEPEVAQELQDDVQTDSAVAVAADATEELQQELPPLKSAESNEDDDDAAATSPVKKKKSKKKSKKRKKSSSDKKQSKKKKASSTVEEGNDEQQEETQVNMDEKVIHEEDASLKFPKEGEEDGPTKDEEHSQIDSAGEAELAVKTETSDGTVAEPQDKGGAQEATEKMLEDKHEEEDEKKEPSEASESEVKEESSPPPPAPEETQQEDASVDDGTGDAEKDEDYQLPDHVPGKDDDSGDEDYESDSKKRSKKKKEKKQKVTKKKETASTITKAKSKSSKTKTEAKISVEKEPVDPKVALKRERDRLRKARIREQKRFEDNESVLLPIMSKWEKALDKADATKTLDCIAKIEENVPSITPAFIEMHGLGKLMKKTRAVFSDGNPEVKKKMKAVKEQLKEAYNEKKEKVPEGFQAKTAAMIAAEKEQKSAASLDKNRPIKKVSKTSSPMNLPKKPPASSERGRDSLSSSKASSTLMNSSIPSKNKSKETKVSTEENPNPKKPSDKVDEVTPQTATKSSAPQKQVKKAFSLKTMIGGPKRSPTPVAASQQAAPRRSLAKTSSSNSLSSSLKQQQQQQQKALHEQQQKLVSWLTDCGSAELPKDENRLFGLEFFNGIADCFPVKDSPINKLNESVMARNLESAIYAWSLLRASASVSTASSPATAKPASVFYWDKIHEVVGSIKGAANPEIRQSKLKSSTVTGSTIVKQIMDGTFPNAMDLVKLSSAKFYQSYRGGENDQKTLKE